MTDAPKTPRKRTVKAAAEAPPVLTDRQKLQQAVLPTKTVPFCTRPDKQERFEEMALELASLAKKRQEHHGLQPPPDLAAAIETAEAALDMLVQEMREDTVIFRFRSVTRQERKKFIVDNPPKPGDRFDEAAGYDIDAVNELYVRTGCIAPADMDDELWESLKLTPFYWDQFLAATNAIAHEEPTSLPFLSAVS